ncbi:MAG: Tad domain-containing protein [Methylobacteriaceae bacterium]|nr:Tad domain-containing protein [Methylobacteriaceae bacterium]
MESSSLTLVPIVLLMSATIDYSSNNAMRQRVQDALDAAVLAGAHRRTRRRPAISAFPRRGRSSTARSVPMRASLPAHRSPSTRSPPK